MAIKTYDGYAEILDRVRGIIDKELLTDMQKDSLMTKIEAFEYEIGEIISGREEDAFQGTRDEQ
tara:strand:+ start:2221 stop:2412 length:192 start_codon:yes stop_codon:yes gene_type:complete